MAAGANTEMINFADVAFRSPSGSAILSLSFRVIKPEPHVQMAAFPPRPPTIRSQSSRMSQYVPIDDDEDLEALAFAQDAGDEDVRTPLDKTIDRIGMGQYLEQG